MDVIKLAFETVIIGLFALPWLWVMIDLVNPDLFSASGISRITEFIPTELRAPAAGLALFSTVYLLGSMIAPVAREFLNDKDMLGALLPTDKTIQVWAYRQVPPFPGSAVPAKVDLANQPDSNASPEWIDTEFQHEESALLLRGTDECERLNRLHGQLTALEGATFNAFALMALCCFAWFGRSSNDPNLVDGKPSPWQRARASAALVLPLAFIGLAAKELVHDVHHVDAGDMPIAELVFLVLGGFGLYVAIFGTRSRLRFHGLMFVFALCFTLLCYTGYGCTEKSYDQAVFSTYQALSPAGTGNAAHPAAQPVLTTAIAQ